MPSNFFSKLVKNTQAPQTPTINGRPLSDDLVASPLSSPPTRHHPQTATSPPSPDISQYRDALASNSSDSVKIGVIPPSPRRTESDLAAQIATHRHSIEQVHEASLQHRRIRSQERERHIPDRHEVSLAARPTSDITQFMDETELTPTPGRSSQAPDWLSSHSTNSPNPSFRQLSPASSTGNLKGFVDKQSTRPYSTQTTGKSVKEKPSKHSMRGKTQPPPPLNLELDPADPRNTIDVQQQAGRHEDPLVPAPNIIVESPTSFAAQKAQSQELVGTVTDGDTKSVRSARSSSSKYKHKGHKSAAPRKTSGAATPGTPMPNTPLMPPLPPLPPAVSGSRSTLSVNGTPTRTRQVPPPSLPARARSPNVSLTRSDFSDGDTFPSSGDESDSSSGELDLNEQDIPVTGFAVASNKRNADFHELFPNIPEGDYLIEGDTYFCCETLGSNPTTQITVVHFNERS